MSEEIIVNLTNNLTNIINQLRNENTRLLAENAELKARLIEGVRGASIDKKIYDDFPEPKPQGE